MLMAAATVRPPAELPHRHRRPALVYPSCSRTDASGGIAATKSCLHQRKGNATARHRPCASRMCVNRHPVPEHHDNSCCGVVQRTPRPSQALQLDQSLLRSGNGWSPCEAREMWEIEM